MAGPQHPFPTGFPNAQQNTMRNQFGGGQMVSGLMGPQQGIGSFFISFLFYSQLLNNFILIHMYLNHIYNFVFTRYG